MSIVLVEQEPESKVVPSVKGAASSICYGPVDRLFIVARYTNTHSSADTQLLLPPKHNRCLLRVGCNCYILVLFQLRCSLLNCVANLEEENQPLCLCVCICSLVLCCRWKETTHCV